MITPQSCQAARALLNWTQRDLALNAQVSLSTVRKFERGGSVGVTFSHAIHATLERHVVLIGGGVLPRPQTSVALGLGKITIWERSGDVEIGSCDLYLTRDGKICGVEPYSDVDLPF
jgi:hypothetical protein